MSLITYNGKIVATASRLRVHFTPPLDTSPNDDPLRRFVYAMARYAADVAAGELEGPYTDEKAELYARELLMPADEVREHWYSENDSALAARFGVPVEQAALRRAEVSADIAAQSQSRPQLPAFDDIRHQAYSKLGDVQDVLRSDWAPGAGPNGQQAQSVREAQQHIARAKDALNRAAD